MRVSRYLESGDYGSVLLQMATPARLARLPIWIRHWLGYRSSPPVKPPEYIVYFWSFVGSFCGLSILQAVFGQAQYFIDRHVPSIIASYVCRYRQQSFMVALEADNDFHRQHLQYYAMAQSKPHWPNLGHSSVGISLVLL